MSSSSSRLQCLGKSSPGSKKQPGVAVTSARSETHKRSDTLRKETVVNRTKPRSLPSCALSSSIQETPKSVSLNLDLLNTEVCAQMSINITPRGEEPAKSAAVSSEELKLKAQPSAVTGRTLASPIAERLPEHEVNEEEEQTDKEDIEDEDLKAPVELIIEFLRAIMDKDFQLASKLCQMILIYEPHNLDASEFLPLIRKQLQKEQEEESSEDDDDDDDDDEDDDDDDDEDDNDNDDDSEDTESDEESSDSSSSSSSSCSSSSSSDDDEEEEK
ncbi:putative uncharacterized protein YGR160W [Anabas testudineus]|uniref:putative uncharacterized protein YGR160W n=1 Tax=Anabas testudineus TaxID=64144 RepID=UPI000E464438|nr:putative uncharacterized protein YGR160W [Anabas testudineus]